MRYQSDDLSYGDLREKANHHLFEEHLGVKLKKLEKNHIMDWVEVREDGNIERPWLVEQKGRRVSYKDALATFPLYGGRKTILIGKNKTDFIRNNEGIGIIYFDFTDCIMYWVYDEEEIQTFDIEYNFQRKQRADCYDRPHDVIHIPCSILKKVE